MDFGFYLPCYWPDMSYHAADMYRDVVEEAQLAEDIGCISLSIPEHHFINYLVHPNPLLTAVRVAVATKRIPIITAVLVLPFYDMRRLAGEIAQADCLTDGRIQLGLGRGAFRYEFDAFGVPMEESREKFNDSLNLLIKLLSETEVSWHSEYYDFGPLTITPRPLQQPYPPIWIAALSRPTITEAVRRGFHVMTTPLRDPMDAVRMQSSAFFDALPPGSPQRFSMLRMGYVAADEADMREKVGLAYANHQRFMNVFNTPGTVRDGAIVPLEVDDTLQDLEDRLLIGTPQQWIDKLGPYAELGIHDIQLNMNFGASHADVMKSLERFAAHVMPHFASA
jgi:alkanesulfonate monooxygenase SsuD/methylene tetrahydromethanopterin reductase-like flavin-dependent oxidoreductase (luciferase family)